MKYQILITYIVSLIISIPVWAQMSKSKCKQRLVDALLMEHRQAESFLRFKMQVTMEPHPNYDEVQRVEEEYTVVKDGEQRYTWSNSADIYEGKDVKVYVDRASHQIYLMNMISSEQRRIGIDNLQYTAKENLKNIEIVSYETEIDKAGNELEHFVVRPYSSGRVIDPHVNYSTMEYWLSNGQHVRTLIQMSEETPYRFMEIKLKDFSFEREARYSIQQSPLQMIYKGSSLRSPYEGYIVQDLRNQKIGE